MKRLALPLAVMASALLILLHAVPSQPESADSWDAHATTYSYGPDGTRALYMLLEQLDLSVQRMRRADYARLEADTVLWTLTEEPFGRVARADLLAFVQRGGTLVAPPRALEALMLDAAMGQPMARAQWHAQVKAPDSEVALALEHMPKALVGVRGAPAKVYAQALTSEQDAGEGVPVVAAWAVGSGKIVSLGATEVVGNAAMGEANNGVFVARLALSLGHRHVFDEFKTGFGEGDLRSLLLRAPYRWGVWQAALVACVALWALVLRRLPVQAQPARRRRNTLDHVEAVAQLWASAQDAGLPLQAMLAALQDRARARVGGIDDRPPFVRWVASVRPENAAQAAAVWAQAQQLLLSARPPVDAARRVVAQLKAIEEESMRW